MTLIIILFIILAALMLLPSQLFNQRERLQEVSDSFVTRLAQLKSEFQFRSKELSSRLKMGDLHQDEWQSLSDELALDTTAAIELTQQAQQSHQSNTSKAFAMVIIATVLLVGISAYQFASDPKLANQQIEMLKLLQSEPQAIQQMMQQAEQQKNDKAEIQKTLEQLFLALRSKLEITPEDADAWRAFAAFSARVGRTQEAQLALKKAINLAPENIDLQVELAQLYAGSEQTSEKMDAFRMLAAILQAYPEHEGALLVSGFNAFSLGFYEVAIKSWETLYAKRAPDSSSAKMLQNSISLAQQKLSEAESEPDAKVGDLADASMLSVEIEIAEQIKKKLSGEETLFVFAKAPDGPNFPLAVVKLKLSELEQPIFLSDANAMQATNKLSDYQSVVVSARISSSGNAIAQPGDYSSNSITVDAPFRQTKVHLLLAE